VRTIDNKKYFKNSVCYDTGAIVLFLTLPKAQLGFEPTT